MNAPKTLTLTLGEIVDLYIGLIGNRSHLGLNGFQKAVGETVIVQPYSFTDETRQKITRNRWIFKPFIDEIDTPERLRLVRLVTGDESARDLPTADLAAVQAWAFLYAQVLKVPHEVSGFCMFERTDLFRENKNPIPSDVEIALGPIIVGSGWKPAQVPAQVPARAPGESAPVGGEP